MVLNLIINGLPSILKTNNLIIRFEVTCFKPYYKWITFNTHDNAITGTDFSGADDVLNLIINGLPSIH